MLTHNLEHEKHSRMLDTSNKKHQLPEEYLSESRWLIKFQYHPKHGLTHNVRSYTSHDGKMTFIAKQ